jgi:hypothetical protein
MLTQIETERRSRGVVIGHNGSSESDEPLAIAAQRAVLREVVVAGHAAASGPGWLGTL